MPGGEEEGRLVYLGVAGALPDTGERRLVLDIGSGSTEIAVGRGDAVELVQSYGVGAPRQGLTFFRDGITPDAFEAALASSRSRFADAGAGALRALRQALVEEGGFRRIAALSNHPARAARMAGGLSLLLALVEELGIDELVPVQAGLRAGVIRALHRRTQQDGPYPKCA